MHVVIAGGPRCGKSTLAQAFDDPFHTDDLVGKMSWSDQSQVVADWIDPGAPYPWCVEGVTAIRALRKWLRRHPEGAPCDILIWCDRVRPQPTKRQAALWVGCRTVYHEIRDDLRARGVHIFEVLA